LKQSLHTFFVQRNPIDVSISPQVILDDKTAIICDKSTVSQLKKSNIKMAIYIQPKSIQDRSGNGRIDEKGT
jgi:hypothetical protein